MSRAVAPGSRPTWFVVLSAAMLMMGGDQVGTGLKVLTHPEYEIRGTQQSVTTDAQRELAWQEVAQGGAACRRHARAVRAMGAGRIAVGFLMLYAAAAGLMRDRRARTMALIAAWVSLPYHAGAALVRMTIWRDAGAQLEPYLQRVIVESGKVAAEDVSKAVSVMRSAMTWSPVLGGVLAAGFSVLILWFFGGRRGRVLFGLDRPALR